MIDITSSTADLIFNAAEQHGILLVVALPDDDRLLPPLTRIGWLLLAGDRDPICGSAGPEAFAPQLADYIRAAGGIALITGLDFSQACADAVARAGKDRRGMIVIQTTPAMRARWLAFILAAAPALTAPSSSASTIWLTPDPRDTRNRHQRRAAGRTEHRRTA